MSKNAKNFPSSHPTKTSQTQKIEVRSRIRDPFILLDAKIEEMSLDPYSYRLYARYVFRGRNSSHFECQKNLESILQMSERKIRDCTKKLQSLSMIEIEKQKRTEYGHFSSNVIYLTDPSDWKFNKKEEKDDDDTGRHHMPSAVGTTCRPPSAPHAGKLDPKLTRSQFNNFDAEKNLETQTESEVIKKETAAKEINLSPKKSRKLSFKKAKTWEDTNEDKKLNLLLNLSCDAHRLGVKQKLFSPFDFDLFATLLKPFYEKYNLDLIHDFYNHAKENKAAINVRESEENFLIWQKRQSESPEVAPESELPMLQEQEVSKKVTNEEVEFGELSEDIRTYAQNLTEKKKEIIRKIIKKSGKFAAQMELMDWIHASQRKQILEKRFAQRAAM